nr:MAG TPA: tail fiber protein [Caudoviricetes sp.]
MPTNDIKPFAAAGGANVLTQAEYLALAALSTGFSSGKANSKEVNKAIRQATFIASALAQFICDKSGSDVLDDGNVAGLVTKLLSAINKTSQPLDATLTALAGLVGAANKLPYFNGAETAELTDLTSVGRDIIGKNDIAAVLQYLGLDRFSQITNATRINSPSGKLYLWINNAAWGVYDDESAKNIPLGVDCGGTGSTTASGAQDNLGISSGIFPIGMPFFWPSASSPAEIFPEFSGQVFLKWNGATFSAATYPKLALVIPSLKLVEARGEFPRIWDDGRGVDVGRALLSAQSDAIRNITGVLRSGSYKTDSLSDGDTGAFSVQSRGVITGLYDSAGANGYTYIDHKFEAGSVVPTASENRPRSIAFNFLVRAK